ncbi:MAG: AraC family transcriptional regulator [Acutalibacteraceae bacterium]|jgi:AraC family transcriptional regulator of arabinose operon
MAQRMQIHTDYDNITRLNNRDFLAFQSILNLMESGATHQSRGYYLAREKCPYAVFFYCFQGGGKLLYNNETYSFSSGDTVILPAGTSHILSSDPDDPFLTYWINVRGSGVDGLLDTYGIVEPTVFYHTDTGTLIQGYRHMLNADMPAMEIISNALLQLTAIVHACVLPSAQERYTTNHLALAIKTGLDNHLPDPDLSITAIAKSLGITASKASKIFTAVYGIGPKEYVTRQRISNSRLLLRSTNLSIKQIASSMGFTDSNYFSWYFKKNTGQSPREFRKNKAF